MLKEQCIVDSRCERNPPSLDKTRKLRNSDVSPLISILHMMTLSK